MSRRLFQCRTPNCPAVLGRLTTDGLILDPAIRTFRAYFDTRKVVITCPQCGARRAFHGQAVFSPTTRAAPC